jgi:hypothetical protein
VQDPTEAVVEHGGQASPTPREERGHEGDDDRQPHELRTLDAVPSEDRRRVAQQAEHRLADREPAEPGDHQELARG